MFSFNAYITIHFDVVHGCYMIQPLFIQSNLFSCLLVHPTPIIECFHYRCNLCKEPHLCVLVGYQYKLVVVLARFVRKSNAVVLSSDSLYYGQRQVPLQT